MERIPPTEHTELTDEISTRTEIAATTTLPLESAISQRDSTNSDDKYKILTIQERMDQLLRMAQKGNEKTYSNNSKSSGGRKCKIDNSAEKLKQKINSENNATVENNRAQSGVSSNQEDDSDDYKRLFAKTETISTDSVNDVAVTATLLRGSLQCENEGPNAEHKCISSKINDQVQENPEIQPNEGKIRLPQISRENLINDTKRRIQRVYESNKKFLERYKKEQSEEAVAIEDQKDQGESQNEHDLNNGKTSCIFCQLDTTNDVSETSNGSTSSVQLTRTNKPMSPAEVYKYLVEEGERRRENPDWFKQLIGEVKPTPIFKTPEEISAFLENLLKSSSRTRTNNRTQTEEHTPNIESEKEAHRKFVQSEFERLNAINNRKNEAKPLDGNNSTENSSEIQTPANTTNTEKRLSIKQGVTPSKSKETENQTMTLTTGIISREGITVIRKNVRPVHSQEDLCTEDAISESLHFQSTSSEDVIIEKMTVVEDSSLNIAESSVVNHSFRDTETSFPELVDEAKSEEYPSKQINEYVQNGNTTVVNKFSANAEGNSDKKLLTNDSSKSIPDSIGEEKSKENETKNMVIEKMTVTDDSSLDTVKLSDTKPPSKSIPQLIAEAKEKGLYFDSSSEDETSRNEAQINDVRVEPMTIEGGSSVDTVKISETDSSDKKVKKSIEELIAEAKSKDQYFDSSSEDEESPEREMERDPISEMQACSNAEEILVSNEVILTEDGEAQNEEEAESTCDSEGRLVMDIQNSDEVYQPQQEGSCAMGESSKQSEEASSSSESPVYSASFVYDPTHPTFSDSQLNMIRDLLNDVDLFSRAAVAVMRAEQVPVIPNIRFRIPSPPAVEPILPENVRAMHAQQGHTNKQPASSSTEPTSSTIQCENDPSSVSKEPEETAPSTSTADQPSAPRTRPFNLLEDAGIQCKPDSTVKSAEDEDSLVRQLLRREPSHTYPPEVAEVIMHLMFKYGEMKLTNEKLDDVPLYNEAVPDGTYSEEIPGQEDEPMDTEILPNKRRGIVYPGEIPIPPEPEIPIPNPDDDREPGQNPEPAPEGESPPDAEPTPAPQSSPGPQEEQPTQEQEDNPDEQPASEQEEQPASEPEEQQNSEATLNPSPSMRESVIVNSSVPVSTNTPMFEQSNPLIPPAPLCGNHDESMPTAGGELMNGDIVEAISPDQLPIVHSNTEINQDQISSQSNHEAETVQSTATEPDRCISLSRQENDEVGDIKKMGQENCIQLNQEAKPVSAPSDPEIPEPRNPPQEPKPRRPYPEPEDDYLTTPPCAQRPKASTIDQRVASFDSSSVPIHTNHTNQQTERLSFRDPSPQHVASNQRTITESDQAASFPSNQSLGSVVREMNRETAPVLADPEDPEQPIPPPEPENDDRDAPPRAQGQMNSTINRKVVTNHQARGVEPRSLPPKLVITDESMSISPDQILSACGQDSEQMFTYAAYPNSPENKPEPRSPERQPQPRPMAPIPPPNAGNRDPRRAPGQLKSASNQEDVEQSIYFDGQAIKPSQDNEHEVSSPPARPSRSTSFDPPVGSSSTNKPCEGSNVLISVLCHNRRRTRSLNEPPTSPKFKPIYHPGTNNEYVSVIFRKESPRDNLQKAINKPIANLITDSRKNDQDEHMDIEMPLESQADETTQILVEAPEASSEVIVESIPLESVDQEQLNVPKYSNIKPENKQDQVRKNTKTSKETDVQSVAGVISCNQTSGDGETTESGERSTNQSEQQETPQESTVSQGSSKAEPSSSSNAPTSNQNTGDSDDEDENSRKRSRPKSIEPPTGSPDLECEEKLTEDSEDSGSMNTSGGNRGVLRGRSKSDDSSPRIVGDADSESRLSSENRLSSRSEHSLNECGSESSSPEYLTPTHTLPRAQSQDCTQNLSARIDEASPAVQSTNAGQNGGVPEPRPSTSKRKEAPTPEVPDDGPNKILATEDGTGRRLSECNEAEAAVVPPAQNAEPVVGRPARITHRRRAVASESDSEPSRRESIFSESGISGIEDTPEDDESSISDVDFGYAERLNRYRAGQVEGALQFVGVAQASVADEGEPSSTTAELPIGPSVSLNRDDQLFDSSSSHSTVVPKDSSSSTKSSDNTLSSNSNEDLEVPEPVPRQPPSLRDLDLPQDADIEMETMYYRRRPTADPMVEVFEIVAAPQAEKRKRSSPTDEAETKKIKTDEATEQQSESVGVDRDGDVPMIEISPEGSVSDSDREVETIMSSQRSDESTRDNDPGPSHTHTRQISVLLPSDNIGLTRVIVYPSKIKPSSFVPYVPPKKPGETSSKTDTSKSSKAKAPSDAKVGTSSSSRRSTGLPTQDSSSGSRRSSLRQPKQENKDLAESGSQKRASLGPSTQGNTGPSRRDNLRTQPTSESDTRPTTRSNVSRAPHGQTSSTSKTASTTKRNTSDPKNPSSKCKEPTTRRTQRDDQDDPDSSTSKRNTRTSKSPRSATFRR